MKEILLAMFLLPGVILPSLGGVSIFLLMEVVNEAADAIAAEFPQVKVHTLAYSITLPPPKNIVPRKNVMIEVASGPVNPFPAVSDADLGYHTNLSLIPDRNFEI